LDSEAKKQLLSGNWTTPHVVGDYLFSVHEGKLTAQPFDPVRLEVSASPVLVAEQIGAGSPSGWASLSMSESGHIAYSSGRSPNRQLIWFDRLGKKLSQVGTVGEYVDPSLSADDRTVAFARVNPETGTPDIWIFDTLRGTESRLTIDSGTDVRPQWSAASRRLIFTSNRAGPWDLYEKEIDGTEPERTVTNPQSAHHKWATHWSRDGRLAVYTTTGAETGWDLWILNLDDTAESRPFLQGPFDETQGVLSPNGQWLAYASNETGRLEVYVRSFPSAGDMKQISAEGGWDPKWSADGTEVFFLSLDGKLMAVNVKVGSDLSPGLPEALFEVSVPRPESPYSTNYVVSSDAKRFLVNTIIPQATSSPITIVLNGLRELDER
jgi:Tol biopolymer transport system component